MNERETKMRWWEKREAKRDQEWLGKKIPEKVVKRWW